MDFDPYFDPLFDIMNTYISFERIVIQYCNKVEGYYSIRFYQPNKKYSYKAKSNSFCQKKLPAIAAPSEVVSSNDGRRTGIPKKSACICIIELFCDIPIT